MLQQHDSFAVSFQKFYKQWEAAQPEKNIDASLEDAWKKKVELLDEISTQNNVVVFVLNIHTKRYLYMSDKLKVLSGIESSSYTAENGLEFSFSRAHPAQAEAVMALNMQALGIFMQNRQRDYKDVLLCQNFLYKNGNNEYIQVLQRSTVLEVNEQGDPLLFISFGHYVGHIKRHDSTTMSITISGEANIYEYDSISKTVLPPKTISKQERKIIELLAQGLDTKEIAEKLFISPHTVDTHRRNLIKKTDCIDATGVVAYAKLINVF